MKQIVGGITAAKGFKAAGIAAGIKYQNRSDMAMIYSEMPCKAAGTFTTNVVKAAPVIWDQQVIEASQSIQAVVINSGIANACTGVEGMNYCKETSLAAAEALNIAPETVLVASTGVIGKQLPIDKIKNGTKAMASLLSESLEAGSNAAKAIMTTDTKSKEIAVQFELGGTLVTIGGMCKGSGMIHPDMCTMLGFITTDINISKELLMRALKEDIKETFNMISVDGDTSTNDTVLLLANGMAGNKELTQIDMDYEYFTIALRYVTEFLAKRIAEDGEGATKLFEVKVVGAKTQEDAKALSKSIITSNLVKTAIYGNDANWGRILCAMGYAKVTFYPENVDLFIESAGNGKLQLVKNGMAAEYSEEEATKILSAKEVTAIVNIKMGNEMATAWGCDLTYDYVKINADYRS